MADEQPGWGECWGRWRRRAPDARWVLLTLAGAVLCLPRYAAVGWWLLRAEPTFWVTLAGWVWAGQLALQGLSYPSITWCEAVKERGVQRGGGPAEWGRVAQFILSSAGFWAAFLLLLRHQPGAAAAMGCICGAFGPIRQASRRRDPFTAAAGVVGLALGGALLARSLPGVLVGLLLYRALRGGWFSAERAVATLPNAGSYLHYYRRRAVPGAHWMISLEYAEAACLVGAFEEAETARNGYFGPVRAAPGSLGARIALGRGDYSAAARLGRQSPLLALAYAGLGDQERAFRIAREAVSRRRDEAHAVMAELLRQEGDLDGAVRHGEESVRGLSCHDRAGGFRALAELQRLRQHWSRAAWSYEQALRWSKYLVPEDARRLVECLRQLGRERRATRIAQALERRGLPNGAGGEQGSPVRTRDGAPV